MVTIGLGIAAGAIIGLPTVMIHNIPMSLTTSVGALLMGLLIGWRRSKSPTFGRIPPGAQWFFEGVGLTAFIAVVGITSGPGLRQRPTKLRCIAVRGRCGGDDGSAGRDDLPGPSTYSSSIRS